MPKPKTPGLADIELDTSFDPFQAPAGGASPKAGAGVEMEKFQVYIPAEIAKDIRVQAAMAGATLSQVFLEAYRLWKEQTK